MGAVLPSGEKPLLVMEFMQRGSLRDLLSNQTFPLDAEQTLPLIRDVLQGVRFLHAADPPIIHGDLKVRKPPNDGGCKKRRILKLFLIVSLQCANVLVDNNFRAKIADFGLATWQKTGKIAGTPFWYVPRNIAQSVFILPNHEKHF